MAVTTLSHHPGGVNEKGQAGPLQRFDRVAWIFILAVITGCMPLTDTTTTPALKYFPAAEATSNPSKPLTYGPLELQAAVMAFADTHASMIGGASERLAQKAGDRDARLTAARVRVYGIASAFEIAAGPYPGIGLLDMIVFTSLNRMVWEDYWVPNVFGPAGNDMLTAFLIGMAWIGAFFAALFIYRLLARWLIKPSKPA